MIIDRILGEHGISGRQLLSFGDGYVEIENTKQVGGLAVAVASDEAHNGSGRVDEWKRRACWESAPMPLSPIFVTPSHSLTTCWATERASPAIGRDCEASDCERETTRPQQDQSFSSCPAQEPDAGRRDLDRARRSFEAVHRPGGVIDRRLCPEDRGCPLERAAVMLIYGAHLLRNGAARILERMMARGWLTHLATNGTGTIHDWEYAWLGASTESVRENVATGTFGTWHETATNIHLALMAGASTAWAMAVRWAGSSMKTARRFPPRKSLSKPSPPGPGIRSPPPELTCCGRSWSSNGPPGELPFPTVGSTLRYSRRRIGTAFR